MAAPRHHRQFQYHPCPFVVSTAIRETEASWQTGARHCDASEVGGGTGGREMGSVGEFMSIGGKIVLIVKLTTGGGIYLSVDTIKRARRCASWAHWFRVGEIGD